MIGRVTWTGYEEDPEGCQTLVSVRLENGKRHSMYVYGVKPRLFTSYYEDESIGSDLIVDIDYGYKSYDGKDLKKLYVRNPRDVNELEEMYHTVYESDIPYYRKVSIFDDLSGYIDVPETKEHVHIDDIVTDIDPSDSVGEIEPRVMFIDIEVWIGHDSFEKTLEEASEPVLCVTTYDNYEEEYRAFTYSDVNEQIDPQLIREYIDGHYGSTERDDDIFVDQFVNEKEMLIGLVSHINEKDPDLLTGWNYTNYDHVYLLRRMKNLGIRTDRMSNYGRVSMEWGRAPERWIEGKEAFDMMAAYDQMQKTALRSKALDYVANEVLGHGKVENISINDSWNNDPEKLIAYNIIDVQLCVDIEKQEGVIQFYYDLADTAHIRITDTKYEMRIVDGYIMSRRGDDEVLPNMEETEIEKAAGAYVKEASTGIKENVGVADLKSLYPSVMITWNISPETMRKVGKGDVNLPYTPEPKNVTGEVTPGQVDWEWREFSLDKQGIIPKYLAGLFSERDKYKEERGNYSPGSIRYDSYDRKQFAMKVIMNCFSGDTDVWTPDGPVKISDLKVGDEVYSVNPKDKSVEMKKVVDTTSQRNLYQKIHHLEGDNVDFKITPNHKMLLHDGTFEEIQNLERTVRYELPRHSAIEGEWKDIFDLVVDGGLENGRIWMSFDGHGRTFRKSLPDAVAGELVYSGNRGQYCLENLALYREFVDDIHDNASFVGIQYGPKHSTIPVRFDMRDWLSFMGWYVSEGFVYKDPRTNCQTTNLCQKKGTGCRRISSLLDRMGISYHHDSNGFTIASTPISIIMQELCGNGSRNKQLPNFIFDLDWRMLMSLYGCMMAGDGDNDAGRYSTNSEQLRDDYCRLLIHIGERPQYSYDSGCWRIKPGYQNTFSRADNESIESHDAMVYCVTLEDNHTLLAGRDGKYQWIGQSFYGSLLNKYGRFSRPGLGDSVTSAARYTLWKSQRVAEENGYPVIYSDTDSNFVSVDGETLDEQVMSLNEIVGILNDGMDEIADEIGIGDEHPFIPDFDLHGTDRHCLTFEAEKIYEMFFQPGKKKRYAGTIVWKDGKVLDEPDLDITGFQETRADSPEITSVVQRRVIEMMLEGVDFYEVSDYLRDIVDDVGVSRFDQRKFALPGSLGQSLEKYDNRVIPRACRYSNDYLGKEFDEGDSPFVYYIRRVPPGYPSTDVIALEWNEPIPEGFVIDEKATVRRAFELPLKSIVEEAGWSFEELLSGGKTKHLETESSGSDPFA